MTAIPHPAVIEFLERRRRAAEEAAQQQLQLEIEEPPQGEQDTDGE
jgi:hypothetical protein